MNLIKNLALLLSLFPIYVFADVNCPSTYYVSNLSFVRADGAVGIWDLYSDRFQHANRTWQVIYTVYLPQAANESQALEYGNEFYQMNISFFDPPMASDQGKKHVCYYAQADSSYFVRAISSA